MTFPDDARRETRTALDALVHQVSQTAREQIDALRAALDGRLAALEGALAEVDPCEPLERLVQGLSRAAADQAEEAATCARLETEEAAATQLAAARAEAEIRLEAERATNAALLNETIEEARQRVHMIQTAAEAERQAVHAEFEARLGLEQAASTELASALAEAQQVAAATSNAAQAQAASLEAAQARLQALDGERTQMQRARDEAEARLDQAEAAATSARLETQEAAATQLAAARAEAEIQLEAERATNAALLDETIEEARQRVHTIQTAAEAERQAVHAEFEARLGLEQAASTELASALAEAKRAAAATWNAAQAQAASLEAAQVRLQALDGERTEMQRARDEVVTRLDAETRSRTGLVESLEAARHATSAAQAETEVYRDQMQAAAEHTRVLEEAHSKLTLEADAQARALTDPRDTGDAHVAPLDRVRIALQAFAGVTSGRDLVETLVEQLSHEFARVALFLVRRNRLEGSLSRGLDPTTDIRNIAIPLTIESPLTRAVNDKTLATLAAGPDGVKIGLFGRPVECAMAWPLIADGHVIAVTYAEHPADLPGGTEGEGQKIAEILTDHVSRRLTSRRPASSAPPVGAGRDILDPADAPPEAEAPHSHPSPTRHARRVKIQEGTEVLVDGSASVLVDLSPVGAQLLSSTVVRPNRSVRLSLPLAGGALACKAHVVWAAFEQSRGDGAVWYRAGVKFTDVDTTAVETFAIEHRSIPQLSRPVHQS
jgi:hypothetical protein